MKILFIIKQRNSSYGISVGLLNSAKFVCEAINHFLHADSHVVEVVDGNDIDREVHKRKPDVVVIEALWVTPDKLKELIKLHPKVRWIVSIHSKAPFLANEGIAMEWMSEYVEMSHRHRIFIACNNQEFQEDLSLCLHTNCLYLPNIYMPRHEASKHEIERHKSHINVGCFGAIRPMKNHLEQAIAAIIFADDCKKRLRFHINADRVEQKGEQVLKNLRSMFDHSRHILVEHGWAPHTEFLHTIRSVDIGMQVSLSESFNLVTSDFVTNLVPVVVSRDISWLPFGCEPTDTNQILSGLHFAWNHPWLLSRINRWYLNRYNNRALGVWDKFLRSK